MTAQLPHVQPYWSRAEFSQSGWSNAYQPEHLLPIQKYDSTTNYAAEEITARSAGFEQQGSVPCPADWYLDTAGNHQALQSLPSFQVIFYCVLWVRGWVLGTAGSCVCGQRLLTCIQRGM